MSESVLAKERKSKTPSRDKTLKKDHQLRAVDLPIAQLEYDLKTRGFICAECDSKCTLGTDGETEYGHQYGCVHSIRQD